MMLIIMPSLAWVSECEDAMTPVKREKVETSLKSRVTDPGVGRQNIEMEV